MGDLTASADIRGRAIDLALAWSDPSELGRNLRVVRRRWGYPTGRADGLALLDLADLFVGDAPWGRVDRTLFLLLGTRAEGGVLQAEVAEYYTAASNSEPSQVVVRVYDGTTDQLESTVVHFVTRVDRTSGVSPGFGSVTTITIYAQPPGGTEGPAGTMVISTQSVTPGPVTTVTDYTRAVGEADAPAVLTMEGMRPDRLDWTPTVAGASTMSVPFVLREVQSTTSTLSPTGPLDVTFVTSAVPTVSAPGNLPLAVMTATNAAPIAIATTGAHGLSSSAWLTIAGAMGNTAANGTWLIAVTGPTTFTLTGSAGNGTYSGGATAYPTVPIVTVRFTEVPNPDTGDLDRSIAITDQAPLARTLDGFDPGLEPGVAYYYAAFEDTGGGFAAGTTWTASALATGSHGFAEKLYALLPAVHRNYDDPASGQQGTWQLRRFLGTFGPALDQVHSIGQAMETLHDIFEVRADYLPYLAHLIGWEIDRTLPTQRQRTDILFAPEVFATVGTVPNVRALVNRTSGWDCQVKEFVNNVFLTNAVERIRRWEIWEAAGTAGGFVATQPVSPAAVTRAVDDSIDARPTVVADPAGGAPWLFWHSDRPVGTPSTVRRRIWMMRCDGADTPRPAMPDTGSIADENPVAIGDVIAGAPAVRLFWSSNRGGQYSLYTLTLTTSMLAGAVPPGAPIQLTNHPAADDQYPAAVRDAGGRIWLFWQSNRRGPTDIWQMTLAPGGAHWSAPQRITSGQPRDGMPACVIDSANHIRLFWSADRGDRSRILQKVFDGTQWMEGDFSSDLATAATPYFQDEAPSAVLLAGALWVFWHSDRDGVPRVYAAGHTGSTWSAAFPVTTGRSVEKDPAPFVTAGAVRLFFRTQRGGEPFRSRTVDLSNLGAMRPGQIDDRWHYTYCMNVSQTSYYSRGAVGLYLTPNDMKSSSAYQAETARLPEFVEPFRPLPTTFVWFVAPPAVIEAMYQPPVDIGESVQDHYPALERFGAIGETYSVAIADWYVLHTNTPGNVSANPTDLSTLHGRVFYPPFQ